MTIDMQQFKKTFLEESFEGLETIEQILVKIDLDNLDPEEVNTIFRAAHSIKGGSGTFGMDELTELTHLVETLLDEVRNNERGLTAEIIEVFLDSVDCLRTMLTSYQNEEAVDTAASHELEKQLHKILDSSGGAAAEEGEPGNNDMVAMLWDIYFAPHENLFLTGNEPLRLIKELDSLGSLVKTQLNISKVPVLSELNPEHCYLEWNFILGGDGIAGSDIEEVFEWVIDDCDLKFDQHGSVEDSEELPAENTSKDVTKIESKESVGEEKTTVSPQSSSIRVDINKIDILLNMVGELVITQSMLCQLGADFSEERLDKLQEGLSLLSQNTRELQESVMKIRMVPIRFIFNRVPRMVFDLSKKLGKNVELKISGEGTELDKTVMEKLSDPLTHLVRNSLDHGIESPEDRVKNDKSEQGTLELKAFHEGGNIIIQIIDDGAGINKEKILQKAKERNVISSDQDLSDDKVIDLIFQPGFSTAEEISDVSGRGVGMDVVRRNIESLGGRIDVSTTEGQGSVFTIQLPLTLAILDGQLFRLGEEIYVLPLVSIIESIQIEEEYLETVTGTSELYKLRDDYVPIIKMYELFDIPDAKKELLKGLLVIVEAHGEKIGLLVDELLAQQQVVIKSLETNYKSVEGISGATILGDGTVALILDIAGIISITKHPNYAASGANGVNKSVAS